MAALVLATLGLPVTALFGTALVVTYGLPLTAETLTLANFEEVLLRQSVTARAFRQFDPRGGCRGGGPGPARRAPGALRRRARGPSRRAGLGMSTLAETTYAIPGLVISIAFILTFLRPLPILGVSIYNTLGIIVLAYLCAFFAVALKPAVAASLQLDPALDEAARVAGAGWGRRMRRIFLPLSRPRRPRGRSWCS
jgi:iron(III) transport system permease protein